MSARGLYQAESKALSSSHHIKLYLKSPSFQDINIDLQFYRDNDVLKLDLKVSIRNFPTDLGNQPSRVGINYGWRFLIIQLSERWQRLNAARQMFLKSFNPQLNITIYFFCSVQNSHYLYSRPIIRKMIMSSISSTTICHRLKWIQRGKLNIRQNSTLWTAIIIMAITQKLLLN